MDFDHSVWSKDADVAVRMSNLLSRILTRVNVTLLLKSEKSTHKTQNEILKKLELFSCLSQIDSKRISTILQILNEDDLLTLRLNLHPRGFIISCI